MGTPQPPHPNQHLLTYTWWDVSPKKGTSQSLAPTVVGHGVGAPLIELGPGGCPAESELAGAGGEISPHLDQISGEVGAGRVSQPGKDELGGPKLWGGVCWE